MAQRKAMEDQKACGVKPGEVPDFRKEETERERDAHDQTPVVSLVDSVIDQAVRQRASDIHFEPMRDGLRIRFRIDGGLVEAMRYDPAVCPAVTARLKIISGMDISEKRKPQDGRATMKIDGAEYDIRVSSIPTVWGEKIAMRLTNRESLTRDKRELGLTREDMEKFDRMLARPHGLILVTGPTGSGKSTTLYTALSELNREEVNIVTVEDPVEADLEGVNQIQVNPKAGVTFALSLRAILRQDPDIIMIGEIRDPETAKIAVQASITGHLVVSTLHTNSAAASVVRLLNMGVEPYLIADALVGVVAQRLVRRLCRCRRCRDMTEAEKQIFEISERETGKIWEPVGCQMCSFTGYYGRIGVFEIMTVNSAMREAIAGTEPSSRIREIALRSGMSTLRAGLRRLVKEGVTSPEEMNRIVCEEE